MGEEQSILWLAEELEQQWCLAGWAVGLQRRVEQGAVMHAGSFPPPGLVAVQLWKAAANGMHKHPCSWAHWITPKVPCFQSEACNFSIAAFFFLPYLSFPPPSAVSFCFFWRITCMLLSLLLGLKWYLLRFTLTEWLWSSLGGRSVTFWCFLTVSGGVNLSSEGLCFA